MSTFPPAWYIIGKGRWDLGEHSEKLPLVLHAVPQITVRAKISTELITEREGPISFETFLLD